uniref:HECT-type E3 ubiquitin transferase n=1 Tax=Elaeis guineensis var. tenera TaxID=51953 RepID=A0A6I9RPF2_ELAGV|nr:LOW QUALITY PROTEIN: E3 ubiquitin-protein ligase UPL2-like [Elaeis guineensis]
MAGHRSSFPMRLQQILSGGRPVSPALKLESEPPPKVKAFIDRVIKTPLHDIAIPLSGFRWEYNKGNFHHWRPLFMHFDTYFKTCLSCRKDLLLSDNISEEDPFPKHSVMQILRVMQVILENCHNKSSFGGLEHFKLLLASTDPEILIATLETLSALVKINPSKIHVSGKLIGCGSVNSCLLSLAQGWGSKEEGLGLHSCVMANERNQHEGLCLFPSDVENKCHETQYHLGSTLHFEYNMVVSQDTEQTSRRSNSSITCVIQIPDLHLLKEDDLSILKQCVDQFNVPPECRFSLLTRIRYAHALRSLRTCRLYSRIMVLAFIVLVQSTDAQDELVSFFANEPEYANELMRLVRSEDSVPGTIRALAILALGAQLAAHASSHERARILSSSSIISVGGNRMVLLNVLQKAVSSLTNPSDPSTPLFVDALLQFFLLHVLSSSSSGSAIRGSAMVPPLLPLLGDSDPAHTNLVCSAVKTLQKLMEYSSPAVSLFKDLGGVELLTQRLQIEVHRVIGTVGENSNTMITGDLKSDEDHVYSQKRLIKALLKALGSATYSPANSTRSQGSHDNSLPVSLSLIFHNVNKFGGDIYFSAVTVMSEIIHKDPTCYPILNESGLPDSFLSSVISGILPSSKALICVPNGLGAICLNAKGLDAVRDTAALQFLVDTFTTRKYLVAMNEGVVLLASAVEELLRHVSSLRSTGVDIIIEIINKLASMGKDKCKDPSGCLVENTDMETDLDDKLNNGHDLVGAMDSAADGISNEQFVQLCIFHVMILVQRTMENPETCRLFVEKGGIEKLLKLLLQPSITQSSEGMPIALHSSIVFKGFTQHHSAPLAHAFSSSLREHLKKALSGFSSVAGSFLLAPRSTPDNEIFSSLFVVEFILFLAASKDNRWISALLTEFGDASRDVLEDIGWVHREVLWQIALFEDLKIEADAESSNFTNEVKRSEAGNESDEQRFSSFRQYLDPLLRRRVSGWSIESQVSDLISIYRDLGRAASGSRRLGMDGHSTLRLASGSQSQSSNSVDANATEEDKQRSYYSSCCEMMKSLSYHISHLFMELGKAMLLASRRENNPINVSTSVGSVVGTVAATVLEHLNFGGHASPNMEISISTKCRYLGKVVDFIDGILSDRPESCNPIMLNCFYGRGVIHAILTTFEATSQLLFAVNRVPASPMETDDKSLKEEKEDMDKSWIYGPLASYGTLMDHLVTSSFILSFSTKQLLEQPIANGNVPFPQDAAAFVKVLQSKVLKSVLPIWTHPHFAECDTEFISAMISIMRHVYSGVEVRNVSGSAGDRLSGPPPDETAISMIVEMGFSRVRAEEALRQVGTNSVEIATDWLFSHPEEPQEDAELARALAMSLGNSDASSKEDEAAISKNFDQEEEAVQLPPVDEILSACIRLLQVKDPLAFPVRDLLVMICSQNDGQYRSKVLNFIIDHVKHCRMASDPFNSNTLSALFHVLALILHEDAVARELASQAGLVKIALDLLSEWNLGLQVGEKSQVPKWVTVCFLSIDRMLQVDAKLASEFTNLDQLKKDDPDTQTPVVIGESKMKDSQSTLGSTTRFLDVQDQKRLLDICCRCIQNQLPSCTMHVVLRLCATLTKVHSVAVSFLDAGGLRALLNLPTSSLFSGFNNVASAIVRHILEDPHTLQQAMESEIRHTLHSNSRIAPRNFIQNLSFVISRDPVVFMKAAHAVCQIEMVGDRPYVVPLKDHDKEKSKEKEKDKAIEKDRSAAADGKFTAGDVNSMAPGSGHGKLSDSNTKNTKPHRKSPQSFTMVIEHLLNLIVTFIPSLKVEDQFDGVPGTPSVADMDIDFTAAKGKGKAIAVSSEDSKIASQEASASLAKTAFILKLLTEILLTYTSSIHVLLRRDEFSSFHRPIHGSSANSSGGIFHHILLKFLPYPGIHKKAKKADGDWRHKLATRANQFLVASSIRSTEGRKRIFSEISNAFNNFIDSSSGCSSPDSSMHAFVDLLNDILAARSPTGAYISAEASATFIDVGLVRTLTRTLQILDLDHADSPKIVTGIVKALETVSREYVHSADLNALKGDTSLKPASDQNQVGSSYGSGSGFQLLETTSRHDHIEGVAGHVESFNAVRNSGSSDSITDDMDHDQDLDRGFAHESQDDFMREASEDGAGNENGMSTVEIRFDIPHNAEDEMGDEDDDMSGDDGDEVDEDEDEDDEENNDLEEDDLHQMSHPDTDQDEHEVDDEEFDEDGLEEDDDDDEDDDGVILRLEEGFNGINVFDHIEVFGGNNNFSSETLSVMPLDIFGSRRQGRTTSIYNLLGRAGDHGVHLEHPLLEEPSSFRHFVRQRQTENAVDMAFSDRNHEGTSSRLDAIFRSLRSGQQGRHRFNMWLDDSQQRGGSSAPAVPPGIEELLVSQLRRPMPDQPSDQNVSTDNPQEKDEPNQLQRSDAGVREETITGGSGNNENMVIPSPSSAVDGTGNGVGPSDVAALQERGTSNANEQVADMQHEHSDAAIRDVEAVSQASSGSGATLGESLRSLEVEIGSADGHDDGERQGPADRLPLGDSQPSTRVRRSLGSTMPIASRDTSLESVSEVPQHPSSQEAGQSVPQEEQQPNRNVDTDAIDPTFLEALPEDLRAEVLSSRQNQVAQPSSERSQTDGEIDPEFLAALPPDIREEVLAQQRAQRLQQSQELEGQPVEMDAVSIIATFPSEIREEVLITSPDTLLATLTPALVAEANMLRERFAHRHYSGTLFGMNSRNRRGESSRQGDTIGSSLDRTTGDVARKSAAGKLIEADGAPLVDTDALKTLIRLLRVVQPVYKGQFQRLLLNLCAHHETRMSLVKILMDMLDLRGSTDNSADAAEPLYRLYGCQSYIAYSRPRFSNGVPPIVSRRVLETLTYLARNHLNVAKLLLHLELAQPPLHKAEASDQGRGKAVIMEEDKPEDKKGDFAIALLLSLLNQPLYMRSVAHLEQLLNLLEVIMVNAESDSGLSNKSGESPDQPSSDTTMQDVQMNTDAVGSSAGGDGKSFKAEDSSRNSACTVNNKSSIGAVLLSLPQAELLLLCLLLAREGLSDNAYVLVAEVLKKIVTIAPSYCSLFIKELAISLQNLTLCARNELHLYVDAGKAVLSTSSTNGTAILRVLQALSSLVVALHEKKDPRLLPEREYASALSQIWDINAALESLWVELSNCISKIESSSESQSDLTAISGNLASTAAGVAPPLPAGTQNILPYIESFFVTCEKLFPGQSEAVQEFAATASDIEDSTTLTSGQKSSGTSQNVDEKHVAFVKFSEKHRKLLNAFIRQNPGLLEKSFSLMLKVPRFIDFDNKRAYFRSKIKHQHDHHHNPVRISVRRAYILEDSYNQLRMRSPQDLKGRLTVHFQGEEGIDAGGLTREWYQLLSRVIFDKGALLFTTVGNESTFQPNPNSVYQTEHLSYFKFVGRVVGKALFDGQLLDVHFTRSFYKHILGVKVTYHDIEAVDPDYYKSLKWILENDKSDILDLTFSIDADEEKLILYEKSQVTDCELIPGGRNIRVTEENKKEYVDRIAEHRLTTAIRPQINAFMEGFNELIPQDLISIFNDKELELLISGLPDIDLDDLRANTEYSGYSNASPVSQWFWEVLQGFSKEDKARFLQFVTGTSKVPLEGFSALQGISGSQKFQIHKAYGSPHHLPSAHTCFNQLDLPEYTSKEQLQERLLLAIHEANEGFGFG